MANIDVTALSNYVEENKAQLINELVLGGDMAADMSVQPGIKTKARIHYLNTNPTIQDGRECGFGAQGTTALTEREIETGIMKVNMEFCDKELLGKYAEYLVKLQAGEETLGFEAELIENIISHIKQRMDKAIFQGDKTSGDSNLNHFDGLLKIAGAASGSVKINVAGSDGAYKNIKAVYMSLPEETLQKGATIYVAPTVYREFLQELVEKNLFHYSGPQDAAPKSYVFPGTDVVVKQALGMAGSDKIFAAHSKDLFLGCDMQSASEVIKVWFSNDDDVFRMKALWNLGTQIAFPSEVVIATITSNQAGA